MTDGERTPVLTGGCQCGRARYALYAPPEGTHLCHCRMCQRAVGGPFAALAPVRKADFAWISDEPARFQSSTVAARHYCRDCGTPLTFYYLESDWIDVTLGSLDEPDLAPPKHHYGIESRVAWWHTLEDLPASTTDQSMEPDRQAAMVSRQSAPRGERG